MPASTLPILLNKISKSSCPGLKGKRQSADYVLTAGDSLALALP